MEKAKNWKKNFKMPQVKDLVCSIWRSFVAAERLVSTV